MLVFLATEQTEEKVDLMSLAEGGRIFSYFHYNKNLPYRAPFFKSGDPTRMFLLSAKGRFVFKLFRKSACF